MRASFTTEALLVNCPDTTSSIFGQAPGLGIHQFCFQEQLLKLVKVKVDSMRRDGSCFLGAFVICLAVRERDFVGVLCFDPVTPIAVNVFQAREVLFILRPWKLLMICLVQGKYALVDEAHLKHGLLHLLWPKGLVRSSHRDHMSQEVLFLRHR